MAVEQSSSVLTETLGLGVTPARVPAAQLISDPKHDRIVMGSWLSDVVVPAGLVSGLQVFLFKHVKTAK